MTIADDTVGGWALGAMAGKVAEKLPQEFDGQRRTHTKSPLPAW